jgi:hypothetical protein
METSETAACVAKLSMIGPALSLYWCSFTHFARVDMMPLANIRKLFGREGHSLAWFVALLCSKRLRCVLPLSYRPIQDNASALLFSLLAS